MKIRHDLKADPAQESAIRQGGGPCAVIAGPGSGKTFVLTEHIRYLIEVVGVDPFSILVLTFSRAAAGQMRSRFLTTCGQQDVVFGTFHSVFFRILQDSSQERLRLIDPAAKQKYLRHLCSSFKNADGSGLPRGTTPEELQLQISRFKNGLSGVPSWVMPLVREYDLYLGNRGCLDFDDMILRCLDLFRSAPDILSRWRQRFQWILVDEFQDVSPSQYQVLLLLAAPRSNLFIVGDDDQSIYGFRGADPETMQRFLQDFSLTEPARAFPVTGNVIFLSTNYRCGRSILKAGASLIRCNTNRIRKDFRAGNVMTGDFRCRPFNDPEAEYAFITEKLSAMGPSELQQTAVIFRTHASAGGFLPCLRQNGIPFLAEGTARREKASPTKKALILQDLMAYYRAASGLAGSGASRKDLQQIMNRPERYLSGSFLTAETMDRRRLLDHSGFSQDTVAELVHDLGFLNTLAPAYSMRYLLDSIGYRTFAVSFFGSGADRILDDLCVQAREYPFMEKWLPRLQELLDGELCPGQPNRHSLPASGCVNILTMHACKGLEYDTVFIPDLNEGNIPAKRAWSRQQVEEERRLLYVAMTRARKSLTLTYLEGTAERPAAPSRFLQPFGIHKA